MHAVILAAGASSRMGQPKALLPHPRGTFLSACIELARLPALVVVAAPHGKLVEREALRCGARVAWNERPEDGQASSLRVGLAAVAHSQALIAIVDQPPFDPAPLIEAARGEPGVAHVPVFRGERGHPFVVPAGFARLLATTAREALLQVEVREHALGLSDVLDDLDSPEDLQRYQRQTEVQR